MFILSVLCAYNLATSQATMHWSIANTPIIYGNDIVLTCETGNTLLNGNCPVRQWFSGPNYKQLIYNSYPSIKTKYEDKTNLSTTNFSLVIKNCTEADLNINYTCSCGFESYTKNLSIDVDNFVVKPERKSASIKENYGKLSIKIELLRVYPQPKCYVIIGNRRLDAFSSLRNVTSVSNGIFYDFSLEEDIILAAADCKKNPDLICHVGKLHSVVTIKGEQIQNCTGLVQDYASINTTTLDAHIHISKTETGIIIPVITVVSVVCTVTGISATVCFKIRKRRHKEPGTHLPVVENDNSCMSEVKPLYDASYDSELV